MLWSLLSIFAFPLSLWVGLHLIEAADLVIRTKSQSKIDASALSLCHQIRKYLESENKAWNEKIRIHQFKMSTHAGVCFTQASLMAIKGGPPAFHARMRFCNNEFQTYALESHRLETMQKIHLSNFLSNLKNTERLLLQQNKIHLKTKISSPHSTYSHQGLKRKRLSGTQRFFEDLIAGYGPKRRWPQEWIAHKFLFSRIFRVEISHRPQEWILETNVALREKKILGTALESTCWLEERIIGERYEVQRK